MASTPSSTSCNTVSRTQRPDAGRCSFPAIVRFVALLVLASCLGLNCAAPVIVSSDPQALMSKANEALENEDFASAAALFSSATKLDPSLTDARASYARCLALQKDWNGAIREADRILKDLSSHPEASFVKASAFLALHRYEDSTRILMQDIEEISQLPKGRDRDVVALSFMRTLKLCRETGRAAEGIEYANSALSFFPESSIFMAYKGFFLASMGNTGSEPGQLFEKALKANPFDTEIVLMVRDYLVGQGEYSGALLAWYRICPDELLTAPTNIASPRYFELIAATNAVSDDSPDSLARLASAYASVGWMSEACRVALRASTAGSATAPALLKKFRDHADFLSRLKAEVYADYIARQDGKGRLSADGIMQFIISNAPGMPKGLMSSVSSKSYTLYAQEANSCNLYGSPVERYFSAFGEFFAISEYFGSAEIVVMPVLSDETRTMRVLNRDRTFRCVVGDFSEVEGFGEYVAGYPAIAGLTFITEPAFWMNAETCRVRSQGLSNFVALLKKEIPSKTSNSQRLPVELLTAPDYSESALRDYAGAAFEEAGLSPFGTEDELFDALFTFNLETVKYHELGHVHDTRYFAPFSENLMNNLLLGLEYMFSAEEIRERFEFAAEATAVVYARPVSWLLYENMLRLRPRKKDMYQKIYAQWVGEEPEDSVYYKVSKELLSGLSRELLRDPSAHPELDLGLPLTGQLHKVGVPALVKAAKDLLPDYIVR